MGLVAGVYVFECVCMLLLLLLSKMCFYTFSHDTQLVFPSTGTMREGQRSDEVTVAEEEQILTVISSPTNHQSVRGPDSAVPSEQQDAASGVVDVVDGVSARESGSFICRPLSVCTLIDRAFSNNIPSGASLTKNKGKTKAKSGIEHIYDH